MAAGTHFVFIMYNVCRLTESLFSRNWQKTVAMNTVFVTAAAVAAADDDDDDDDNGDSWMLSLIHI